MVKQKSSKIKAEKPKRQKKATKPKVFEYGDLSIVCSCGATQTLEKGMQQGLQIILTTRSDSFVQLRCDKCPADIKLCFLEGVEPAKPITEADLGYLETEEPITESVDENVQEDGKEEQVL
jgi:hypothetical protein